MAASIGLVVLLAACTDAELAKQEYFESGQLSFEQGRYDEAIIQYRNALRQDGTFGLARWQLAESYAAVNNLPAALREYIRAADLLPERADVQLKTGSLLLVAQQFEDARDRAERALRLEPGNVEALILRANAMAAMDDVTGAISEIEEALGDQPSDNLFTSLGALRAVEGKDAEAEAAFKNAIRLNPQSIEAKLALAHFYWMRGRGAEVEGLLSDALAVDATHGLANRMLAGLYLATGRVAQAEAPLRRLADNPTDPVAKVILADYYVRTGRGAEARTVLQTALKEDPTSETVLLRLARIDYSEGRRDAATRSLEEVLALTPQHADALVLRATWELEEGRVADAIATAQAAIAADERLASAHLVLGQALAESQQIPDALRALTEAVRLNGSLVSAQVMLSRLRLGSGETAAALELANDAKRRAPQDPNVQLALARSLLVGGDTRRAEPEVRALVANYPEHAASHSAAGLLALAKKDPAGARAAFGRALALDPDYIEALAGLLLVDANTGRLPEAVTRIEARLAAHPENARLRVIAGRTYMASRDSAKAETVLREAIRLTPNHLEAYGLLGQMYASQRRLPEAVAEFDKVARADGTQVGAATMAAMLVQLQGQGAEAQKRYESIIAANPRAAVAANNLAWMYAEAGGNLDIALQLAQVAKAQLPDVAEVNDTLGWVYYKRKLPQLAIPFLEQSVAADGNNAGYRLRLGLAYAQAGQRRNATTTLRGALDMDPSVEGAELARQVLADLNG